MSAGLTVSVSPETSDRIRDVARSQNTTVNKVLQKALQLLLVAEDARKGGQSLGVIDADKKLVAEIVDF
jgi:predicted transcriptional regulator